MKKTGIGFIERGNNRKSVLSFLFGFCGFWVVYAGLESGILDFIKNYGHSIRESEILKSGKYNSKFLSIWLKAAYAFGIIERNQRCEFWVSDTVKQELFNGENSSLLSDKIKMYARFGKLYESFSKGSRINNSFAGNNFKQSFSLISAMAEVTRNDYYGIFQAAKGSRAGLDGLLQGKRTRLLDIGTGFGYNLLSIADKYPNSHIMGIDIDPRAVAFCVKRINSFNLQHRIIAKVMDARKISFTNNFDIILMNLSLHEIDSDLNNIVKFLKKCKSALRKSGYLIISELISPESFSSYRSNVGKSLASMEILEFVLGYNIFSLKEVKNLLASAGFKVISIAKQADPLKKLIISRK